jgi:hypothetical protein
MFYGIFFTNWYDLLGFLGINFWNFWKFFFFFVFVFIFIFFWKQKKLKNYLIVEQKMNSLDFIVPNAKCLF